MVEVLDAFPEVVVVGAHAAATPVAAAHAAVLGLLAPAGGEHFAFGFGGAFGEVDLEFDGLFGSVGERAVVDGDVDEGVG